MRLITCEIHGESLAILDDAMLVRYKCSHCIAEEEGSDYDDDTYREQLGFERKKEEQDE